jgi:hypothetical protein
MAVSCSTHSGQVSVGWGHDTHSGAIVTASSPHKKGPPAHAPAHGYRAKHHYRYYPGTDVYYDTGRRLYFYLSGNDWAVAATLPAALKVKLGDYVSIEMATDRPYMYHKAHKAKYKAKKPKKSHQKKWANK